jgi:EAL domain-containing protein (putative c-di-GMP-specific phosphodiesterase class I)
MRRTVRTRSKGLDEFDFLDESRGVGVVFQPIVELSSGDVVGYEALARTPDGSSIAAPEALFAEAYRRGRVGELDWVCRAAVFRAALDRKVPSEVPLFVKVEPAALNAPCPADIIGLLATADPPMPLRGRSDGVVSGCRPGRAAGRHRSEPGLYPYPSLSVGVALDDVGADPASLARSMGATLSQGGLFGPPAPLPDDLPVPAHPLRLLATAVELADTPFTVAAQSRAHDPSRRGARQRPWQRGRACRRPRVA